jgi:hypothetical protein
MARSVGCEAQLRNLLVPLVVGLLLLTLPTSAASAQACLAPPTGIVAWWPFDETSGTTAADIAGNNVATYVNGVQSASV